jgi:hypothetical protein
VAPHRETPPAPDAYTERLSVPWWSWPAGLGLAALFAAEVFLGRSSALTWLPYAILLPATAVALIAAGRVRIRVGAGELYVDDAHLPVTYVTEVSTLDATSRRAVLGPLAESNAFVVQRPWISGGVRVTLNDPADPTPYWVVSSRHPQALAAAIVAARDGARQPA